MATRSEFKEEFNRLTDASQDLEDIRTADIIISKLDHGDSELIPSEFANRIIDGESPLAVYRELRGFNQSTLSKASSVNRTQIADIETGRSIGSIATFKKLAQTLKLSIDDLVI